MSRISSNQSTISRSVGKAKPRGRQPSSRSSFKVAKNKTAKGSDSHKTSRNVASRVPAAAAACAAPSSSASLKCTADGTTPGPKQLWLMKTDPEYMRLQVDKLIRDIETTWTGVRGYEARNLLRDHFRVGDHVLFYHSGDPKHMSSLSGGSIKEPGIAAVCVVSKAAFPEAGAPLNAKGEVQWYSVCVRLLCTVSPQLSLQRLRAEPSLAGMDLFLRSRLSIQRVEDQHWQHIITMAGLQSSPFLKN